LAWKKTVDERIVDEWFRHVQHLLRSWRRQYLLAPPPTGFGVGAIKKAVRIMVERVEDPQELDWGTLWGRLDRKDYDHMEDFIEDLEASNLLPRAPPEDETEVLAEDLDTLLKGFGLEMPNPADPNFELELGELLRTLASNLAEAEQTSEKVLLRGPDGKKHWYSAKGVEKLFAKVHERYREEKGVLREVAAKEKKLREEAEKAQLIKFRPTRDFKEGMVPYFASREYETADEKWLREKEKRGLIRIVGKPRLRKKLTVKVKLEVERMNGTYWVNIMYQNSLICGTQFSTFQLVVEHLETGEEHIDLYFQAMRQLGDEEAVMKELKGYPPPFNSKEIVRAYWTMDDVNWDVASRDDYRIHRTTYREAELTALNVEKLKRIARVKLGKTYPTKRELINAILGKPTVEVVYEKPAEAVPTLKLAIPKELKAEANSLWASYRSAVMTGDTSRSEKALQRLKEIRSQLLRT